METDRVKLQSGVSLGSCPKIHTVEIEKAISPRDTVRRVMDKLGGLELELVREIIRIDSGRLGIPVYICSAGKDCNIPTPKTMGKGATPEQSEASALMEMVERFSHANYPRANNHRRASFREVERETLPLEQLVQVPGRGASAGREELDAFADLPFAWIPAYSLTGKRDFLLPYEWFADIQGTNGLSAGNTMEETVLQGLCEVVERHVCAVINVRREPVPTIDLGTVRDPVAGELLGKFARNNIRIMCKDFSLNTGIPTVAGIAFDPATFPNSEIVFCAGTSTHPEKALIRTLTEIQQMAVDTFQQDYYAGGILPKFRNWRECNYLFTEDEPVSIQSLPDVSSTDMLKEIENCAEALQNYGFEPLVVDITHPELGIPSVFVMMPGAELFDSSSGDLHIGYYLGRRMEFTGRLEEAILYFRESLRRHPKSALHAHLEIANCLMYQQRWESAINAYMEAYRHGPDRAMQMQIMRSLSICNDKRKEAVSFLGNDA
jgi:ribosomal protein S12 methylthiotransferase accessory factor